MAAASVGDTVKVHYTGTLEDGSQFDSSEGRDPLAFTLGEGGLIRGFEQAVLGMAEGDKKTVKITADEGYGDHRPEMVQRVARSTIPPQSTCRRSIQGAWQTSRSSIYSRTPAGSRCP